MIFLCLFLFFFPALPSSFCHPSFNTHLFFILFMDNLLSYPSFLSFIPSIISLPTPCLLSPYIYLMPSFYPSFIFWHFSVLHYLSIHPYLSITFHPIPFCSSVITIYAASSLLYFFYILPLTSPFLFSFSLPILESFISDIYVFFLSNSFSSIQYIWVCCDCVCMTQCFRERETCPVMVNNIYRIMLITLKGKYYPLHYLSLS